jgi:hypothetical protein
MFGRLLCREEAQAQTVLDDFDIPNGIVNAMCLSGNMLYIGGAFRHVGPSRSGTTVYAGGGFSLMGNLAHSYFAEIEADPTGVPHFVHTGGAALMSLADSARIRSVSREVG